MKHQEATEPIIQQVLNKENMEARITEVFYSLQGEGKCIGTPSIFIRFFGCNLKCEGFGMPPGKKSLERYMIVPDNFKSIKELPLVSTGCDSYVSWDPRFKSFSKKMTPKELIESIYTVFPHELGEKEFHIVITGGEPLLPKTQEFLIEFFNDNFFLEDIVITFETNGTQYLIDDFYQIFMEDFASSNIIFSVSPKLSSSGNNLKKIIDYNIINQYDKITNQVYFKFVIQSEDDIKEIEDIIQKDDLYHDIYVMPVGGTKEIYEKNKIKVAELALEKGWKFSDRLQCSLWGNSWEK